MQQTALLILVRAEGAGNGGSENVGGNGGQVFVLFSWQHNMAKK